MTDDLVRSHSRIVKWAGVTAALALVVPVLVLVPLTGGLPVRGIVGAGVVFFASLLIVSTFSSLSHREAQAEAGPLAKPESTLLQVPTRHRS